MLTKALGRKLVASAAFGLVFGGATIAAAAVGPIGGSGHKLAVDEPTTVSSDSTTVDESTTTTVDESTTTTVDESTTTTVDESTTTTVDESTTTTTVAPSEPCNHGQAVSDVAHSAPRGHDAPPGAHGKAVSAVAHQKCAGHGDDEGGAAGDDASTHGNSGAKHSGHDTTGEESDD
jgi:hypothetical protein